MKVKWRLFQTNQNWENLSQASLPYMNVKESSLGRRKMIPDKYQMEIWIHANKQKAPQVCYSPSDSILPLGLWYLHPLSARPLFPPQNSCSWSPNGLNDSFSAKPPLLWWQASILLITGSSTIAVEWIKFGWMGSWVEHVQEQVSVHSHASFISSPTCVIFYATTYNSSRKGKDDLYSTHEEQPGIFSNSPVIQTINSLSASFVLFNTELHSNETHWEVDEVNGENGVKVSKNLLLR